MRHLRTGGWMRLERVTQRGRVEQGGQAGHAMASPVECGGSGCRVAAMLGVGDARAVAAPARGSAGGWEATTDTTNVCMGAAPLVVGSEGRRSALQARLVGKLK